MQAQRPAGVAARAGLITGLFVGILSLPVITLSRLTSGAGLSLLFLIVALVAFAIAGYIATRRSGLLRSGVGAGALAALIAIFIAICLGVVIVALLAPRVALVTQAPFGGAPAGGGRGFGGRAYRTPAFAPSRACAQQSSPSSWPPSSHGDWRARRLPRRAAGPPGPPAPARGAAVRARRLFAPVHPPPAAPVAPVHASAPIYPSNPGSATPPPYYPPAPPYDPNAPTNPSGPRDA